MLLLGIRDYYNDVIVRYETNRWVTLNDYTYGQWNRLEGGAFRVEIENANIYMYLNNGDVRRGLDIGTVKISKYAHT